MGHMIPIPPLNTCFSFTKQPNAWTTGYFSALKTQDIPHFVSTRQGPDGHVIRDQTDQAVTQVAHFLGKKHGAWLDQVHGPTALYCDKPGLIGEADALYTNQPDLVLVGKSADCPLILVAEKQGNAVGFAHASWRSTVAGITPNLIQAMIRDLHCQPQDLIACICPSAGPECYEVGPEVYDQTLSQLGSQAEAFFVRQGDKFLFDLWQANSRALQQNGLLENNIHLAGLCTLCHNDLFPSYRKEGLKAGRFIAAICLSGD
jgi:YfiH family protein